LCRRYIDPNWVKFELSDFLVCTQQQQQQQQQHWFGKKKKKKKKKVKKATETRLNKQYFIFFFCLKKRRKIPLRSSHTSQKQTRRNHLMFSHRDVKQDEMFLSVLNMKLSCLNHQNKRYLVL